MASWVTLGCVRPATRAPSSTATHALTSADSFEAPPPKASPEPLAPAPAAPVATPAAPLEAGGDPLALAGSFEEMLVPSTAITPASRVRRKTAADLDSAIAVVTTAATTEAATEALTHRLGEPTWTEGAASASNTKRRVWVAPLSGHRCRRLILEPDGTTLLDSADTAEWRMLTTATRQNPCTGELRRGVWDGSGDGRPAVPK
jgi:hypothetical protein